MAKRRDHRRAAAFKQSKRERGRGLLVDDSYALAMARDRAAFEWLARRDPRTAAKVEHRLRELRHEGWVIA